MTAEETTPGEVGSAAPAPEAGNAQPSGSGLRALSAEDKGRIGQLIKVLAQERRDKENFRQELDQEKARLQELQKERDSGRQQERALVARVSSALHLLRKYQQELYLAHNRDQAEEHGKGGSAAPVAAPSEPPAPPAASVRGSPGMNGEAAAPTSALGFATAAPSRTIGAYLAALSPSAAGLHSRGDVGTPAQPGLGQPPADRSASKVSPPPSPISSSASERPRLRSPSPAVLATAAAVQAVQTAEVEVPVLTPASSHSSTARQSRFTSLGVLQQPQLKLLQRYLHIQQGGDGTAAERAIADASAAAALEAAPEPPHTGGVLREGSPRHSSDTLGPTSLRSPMNMRDAWRDPAAQASRQEGSSLAVVTPATPPVSPAPAAPLRTPGAHRKQRHTAAAWTPAAAWSPVTPPAAAAAPAQAQSPLAQPGWKPLAPAPGAVPTPSLFPPSLGAESRHHASAQLPRAPPHHEREISLDNAYHDSEEGRSRPTLVKPILGHTAPQHLQHREALLENVKHDSDDCSRPAWSSQHMEPARGNTEGDSGGDGLRRSSRSPMARFSAVSRGNARPPLRGRSGSPRRSGEFAQRSTPSTPSSSVRHSLAAANLQARAPTTPLHSQPRSPQVTQSPEPLLESPSLRPRSPVQHRASRGSSLGTARSSWAVCIDDGYYGPAMFDVLDSVESAISLGSSFLSSTAVSSNSSAHPRRSTLSAARRAARDSAAALRGGEHGTEDLRRLQRELAELERRVYGQGATEVASSTEAIFLGSSRDAAGGSFSHEPFPPPSPLRQPQRGSFVEGRATPGPADVAPSTPPRKSREFDVCGLRQEAPRAPASPAFATPLWPAMPRQSDRATSSTSAPKLEEIDDVLELLHRAPPAEHARG